MSSQYVAVWPTSGWDRFGSLGHSSKFQWLSRLGFVTAVMWLTEGQRNFARCLAVSWAATLNVHFRGLLPLTVFLPDAKCTLRPILAFSYIGSITARHSSSGRQPCWTEGATYIPIFGRAAITFGIGPHLSYFSVTVLLNFTLAMTDTSTVHERRTRRRWCLKTQLCRQKAFVINQSSSLLTVPLCCKLIHYGSEWTASPTPSDSTVRLFPVCMPSHTWD